MALTAERRDQGSPRPLPAPPRPPRAHRLAAGALALLGYGYLAGLLASAGMVGVLGLLAINWQLSIWLFLPVGGVALLVLNLLWVRLPAPEGIALSRHDAGALFAVVDELRLALGAPAIEAILLTDELAVRIVEQPELGLFGRYRRTMLVGLPLLQALSWDQTQALIARELALLAGTPGWFDGWLRRRRLLWGQLLGQLRDDRRWWRTAISGFFRWYIPAFLGYSAPLVQVQEFAADHTAAGVVGTRHVADALINLAIVRRFLDQEFWPGLYRQITTRPEPPAPYGALGAALPEALGSPRAAEWLAAARHESADPGGSTLPLAERLAALGQEPRLPIVAPAALQRVFGTSLYIALSDMDRRWQGAIAEAWRDQHGYAQETLDTLRELDQTARVRPLTADEALRRAQWTEEFGDTSAALVRYREAVAVAPKRAAVHFALGRLLLARGDGEGVGVLGRAMDRDPELIMPACALIVPFLLAHNRAADAERYRRRAHGRMRMLQAAQSERRAVLADVRLIPHALAPDRLAWLTANLVTLPALRVAYLARKDVSVSPERPVYVLGIVAARQATDAVAAMLEPIKDGGDTYLVVALDARNGWLQTALERVPGGEIYRQ